MVYVVKITYKHGLRETPKIEKIFKSKESAQKYVDGLNQMSIEGIQKAFGPTQTKYGLEYGGKGLEAMRLMNQLIGEEYKEFQKAKDLPLTADFDTVMSHKEYTISIEEYELGE